MKGPFSEFPETLARLQAAGWHAGRQIDISQYLAWYQKVGYPSPNERVRALLSEFGGLHFDVPPAWHGEMSLPEPKSIPIEGPSRSPFIKLDFAIDPLRSRYDDLEVIAIVERTISDSLFPVGDFADGSEMLISAGGAIYKMDGTDLIQYGRDLESSVVGLCERRCCMRFDFNLGDANGIDLALTELESATLTEIGVSRGEGVTSPPPKSPVELRMQSGRLPAERVFRFLQEYHGVRIRYTKWDGEILKFEFNGRSALDRVEAVEPQSSDYLARLESNFGVGPLFPIAVCVAPSPRWVTPVLLMDEATAVYRAILEFDTMLNLVGHNAEQAMNVLARSLVFKDLLSVS